MHDPKCVLTIQHGGTVGTMNVMVPRLDGPRLLSIGPGESADIDVTQMVWPALPAAEPRKRADWLALLVVMAPSALLAALATQALEGMGLVVVMVSTLGWLAAAIDVWKAARA